jgi:hypothetical protein
MNIPMIIQDFLSAMQRLQPGLEATLTAGAAIQGAGATLVTVLQKGNQLVTYFARRKKSKRQAKAGHLAPLQNGEPIATKANVAIVVDISRRSLRDVEHYLVANNIDADLIVVTNDPSYGPQIKHLNESDPDAWFKIVQEFNTAINAIKHELGATNIHIFISAPLAIAFGLGAVWGTVDRANIYHWNQVEYKRVLEIRRELRFEKGEA